MVERKKAGRKPGRSVKKNGPNPIDVHVGKRVRLRRTLLGMSQSDLANALDMAFQQVQKYERGANRISASRLFEISIILNIPVAFFFDDMSDELIAGIKLEPAANARVPEVIADPDPMAKRETLELVRAYYRIPEIARRRVFELMKTLADGGGHADT